MKFKKHIKEIIITLLVISITGISYAALLTVSPSDPLTDSIWNSMVGLVNQNEVKLTNISSVGGNVGIGDLTPSYKLDVKNTSNTLAQFYYNDGLVNPRLQIQGISDGIDFNSTYSTNGGTISFSNAGSELMRVDKTGNVGIGLASPTRKLEVQGDSTLQLSADNGDTLVDVWNCAADGACLIVYKGDGTTRAAEIRGDGSSTYFNDGNVGIGTITPEQKLHVKNNGIRIENTRKWDLIVDNSPDSFQIRNITSGSVPFTIHTNGNIDVNGSFHTSSDVRLKEEIEVIDGSLDKIMQLNGVNYFWKDKEKFSDQKQLGVIAQNVEEYYPEIVSTNKKTGYKSVDYSKLVAPLIEAVKELKNENDELKGRIELLENK